MSLRDLLNDVIADVFVPHLDDLAHDVTLVTVDGNPVYDPRTGTTTAATRAVTVKGLRTRFSWKERMDNKGVTAKCSKILIPGRDLPVKPDVISSVVYEGRTHNVVEVLPPPGDALFLLHVTEA